MSVRDHDEGGELIVCHPRNDHLIVELIEAGKLIVDPTGAGSVFLRDEQDGLYRLATERIEQAGKRPKAAYYRKMVIKWQGRVRSLRVHRVVWVWCEGPTHLEIDHVDDNTMNCGRANLAALTRGQNEYKKREAQWLKSQGLGPDDEQEYCAEPF